MRICEGDGWCPSWMSAASSSHQGLDKVKATCRELVQVSCWSTEPFMCKRLGLRSPNVKCIKGKQPWKERFHHVECVWVIASHGGTLGHIDAAIPDQRQHTREVPILCFPDRFPHPSVTSSTRQVPDEGC